MEISDYALKWIATGNALNFLNLSLCKKITGEGTKFLCGSTHRLESLDLSYCHNLTDLSIKALFADGAYAELKYLSLRGCSKLSDSSVFEVIRYAANLIVFDIYGLNTKLVSSIKKIRPRTHLITESIIEMDLIIFTRVKAREIKPEDLFLSGPKQMMMGIKPAGRKKAANFYLKGGKGLFKSMNSLLDSKS